MAAAKKTSKTSDGAFAVIAIGGKQYKVAPGQTIQIEKLKAPKGEEFKKGDNVTFSDVLLTDDGKASTFGAPMVSGAKVTGEIVTVGRLPKVTVIKYKQKSRYFKKNGHRQPFMKVKINTI